MSLPVTETDKLLDQYDKGEITREEYYKAIDSRMSKEAKYMQAAEKYIADWEKKNGKVLKYTAYWEEKHGYRHLQENKSERYYAGVVKAKGIFGLFRLIKFNLFYKKLLKCREITEYYDFYVISIFVLLYSLKKTKNFRFITNNDCCLFDIGLFALFLAKITELSDYDKKNLDMRLIFAYISIYKKTLNSDFCEEKDLTTVAFSRFELYDNVYKQKSNVSAVLNEFCKIVKVDVSIEALVHFYTDVPLCLLDSFEKACTCDCVCDTLFKQLIPSSFKTIPGIIEDAHKLKLI